MLITALSLFVLTIARAEEPTRVIDTPVVPRTSRVEKREAPPMACREAGPSGAAEVSHLTEQVIFLYPQIKGAKTCSGYVVTIKGGQVCSAKPDLSDEICSWSSGFTETSICLSREEALRDQVARIEGCSGITPAPRPEPTVRRAP